MIQINGVRYSLMIIFAVTLHYIWGFDLLLDGQSINATALHVFVDLFDIRPHTLALILWVSASMSLLSLVMRPNRFTIALMLPQQYALMISAYGAIAAIASGHFGDGVQRPEAFIMNDQSYAVLAALFHTLAILGRLNDFNQLE